MSLQPENLRTTRQRQDFTERLIKYIPSISNRLAQALRQVDRARFIPNSVSHLRTRAYQDTVIKLEEGSSISQPSLVVKMLHELDLQEGQNILEIGTASGYQAALLSVITGKYGHIHTIELKPHLSAQASQTLQELFYNNVKVYSGDGSLGISDSAPYDRIIVSAGVENIPQALINQLKIGGKIVAPIGKNLHNLDLVVGTKQENGDLFIERKGESLSFVPLEKYDTQQMIVKDGTRRSLPAEVRTQIIKFLFEGKK